MSQQIQNLKEQVKKAFIGVESEEYLNKQITKVKCRLSENFCEYIKKHPVSNFREWSEKFIKELNYNSTVSDEIMAIGISLLALDQLEHDMTNIYVNSIYEARHS